MLILAEGKLNSSNSDIYPNKTSIFTNSTSYDYMKYESLQNGYLVRNDYLQMAQITEQLYLHKSE